MPELFRLEFVCRGDRCFEDQGEGPLPRRQRSLAAGLPITEIEIAAEPRISTRIPELDRVLGGGIVPGSVVLVGGDPGIGKSTLMMQMAAGLRGTVVRSILQVRNRFSRSGCGRNASTPNRPTRPPSCGNRSRSDRCHSCNSGTPEVVIVDSIQTMSHPDVRERARHREPGPGGDGVLHAASQRRGASPSFWSAMSPKKE